MAIVEKKETKMQTLSSGKYSIQKYEGTPTEIFDRIRETFGMEPVLGEVLIIANKPYFTSSGCSRIAESKQNKSIQYEHIDSETFPIYKIRKNPENYIIVKCILTTARDGIIEGYRVLDMEEEKRYAFRDNCGNKGCKAWKGKYKKTSTPGIKKCPDCGAEIKGYDNWRLSDYINFAETKAFMRAVGKAYNIPIFEENHMEKYGIKGKPADLRTVINVQGNKEEITKSNQALLPEPKITVEPKSQPIQKEINPTRVPSPSIIEEDMPENPFESDEIEQVANFEVWLDSLTTADKYCLVKGEFQSETEKAKSFYLKDWNKSVWFPKSQIKDKSETEIWISRWMLEKNKDKIIA